MMSLGPRHEEPVELAGFDALHERDGLDELIARRREEPPLAPRSRRDLPADALERRGDASRRAHLHDQIDVANVDTELE